MICTFLPRLDNSQLQLTLIPTLIGSDWHDWVKLGLLSTILPDWLNTNYSQGAYHIMGSYYQL